MKNIRVVIEDKLFNRVTKDKAKTFFENGKNIYILPCNVNPNNMWIKPVCIEGPFDEFVNAYTYYNCNKETGEYVSFYVAE